MQNEPNIQPIIETLLDDGERTEMFSFAPEHEPLTEEDLIAWEKQMRESMTIEDWRRWGLREGETDEQHALRCHNQLWENDPRYNGSQVFEDKRKKEAALVQALHDQDVGAINKLIDEINGDDDATHD